jgi:hypothetical protein
MACQTRRVRIEFGGPVKPICTHFWAFGHPVHSAHANGAGFHVARVGTGKPLLLLHGAAAGIAKFFTRIC